MAIYRIRWRAELIFKQWKGCLKIHLFKGYRLERIHCLLYGRLAMILLLGSISPFLMKYALTIGRELSCHKMFKYFTADHVFAEAIRERNFRFFLEQLFEDIPRRLFMDKRKKRLTLRENAKRGISYYKEQEINDLQKNVA